MTDVKYEFLTVTLPIILTMLGGVYIIKSDSHAIAARMDAKVDRFEARMEKIDERWIALLEKFHSQDKRILRMEDKNEIN